MSDFYLQILKTQLEKFHELFELSEPESDVYYFAMNNLDRLMATLCPEREPLDQIMAELDKKPTTEGLQ